MEAHMKGSNSDLVDPASVMDSGWSGGASSSEPAFAFAFNESYFSDRVLRIEITPDPVEETASGGEASANNNGFSAATVVRVNTLHINSAILAVKSPYFYKLFSNGMKESEERHVTIRINAYEEAAVMELLKFMYMNTLSVTAAPAAVLDVLMAADKFEVSSCMRYCSSWLLQNSPMTTDSALFYMEQLPQQLPNTDAVQPLIDAAKQYLARRYKDITKLEEEVMALPLCAIEAILSSDYLQVESEDAVYDFVLKWARQHYNQTKERREVLDSRLALLIRFPYMTWQKLKEFLNCNDFNGKTKLVYEALMFKGKPLHLRRQQSQESASSNHRCFVERAYMYRPVKVVNFELPLQQCVVYLDLKLEECAALFPSGRVHSQAFYLGGQGFFLSAECNMDQQLDGNQYHCFGLFLGMQGNAGSVSLAVDYEFAARSKPKDDEFVSKHKGNYTITGGEVVGQKNLFQIPWNSFIAEDSLFFINGVLHLSAELTIK